MEALKSFEWVRDTAGYRLAWLPDREGPAHWITELECAWSEDQVYDPSSHLNIHTSQYQGEKRIPQTGMYIVGQRQYIYRKNNNLWNPEIIRPFSGDEVLSLNLIKAYRRPIEWLEFTNKYGMLGHRRKTDRWHMSGKERGVFFAEVEHEGEWHQLINVLRLIYEYYGKIRDKDVEGLSEIIKWESGDVVRYDRGLSLDGQKIMPAIAMRGKIEKNAHYFEFMEYGDVFLPAAIQMQDSINGYLEEALSLRISVDPQTIKFESTLRYGSFGAALIAEAVEFMTGGFEARQCTVCRSWFRIGAKQNRQDRIFCSDACKMRDYRARKRASAV